MPSNRPRRSQDTDKPALQPTRGRLNNVELAAIVLIGLAVLLYAFSKCGGEPDSQPLGDLPVVTEEVVDSANPTTGSTASDENGSSSFSTTATNQSTELPTANADSLKKPRTLYILVDSLRLRQTPERTGTVLAYLRYGEEVLDLGEASALEKLRVSADEVRSAPWVKVRTNKGQVGWAFGAYMQFYPVPRVTATTPTN